MLTNHPTLDPMQKAIEDLNKDASKTINVPNL